MTRVEESAARCLSVIQGSSVSASDQLEALLFRIAWMVTRTEFPVDSKRLLEVSETSYAWSQRSIGVRRSGSQGLDREPARLSERADP
jgi:hypothetical protein